MNATLDAAYFEWLYSHTDDVRRRKRTQSHWCLMQQLHAKEFLYIILRDENRAQDGKDLRYEFLEAYSVSGYGSDWSDRGCSMLELLIALSKKLSFHAGGEERVWFWHLIEQMDLEKYNDANYNMTAEGVIDETLDRIIYRTYAPNGVGGLFPLRNPSNDQRKVELWIQLNAYLNEL